MSDYENRMRQAAEEVRQATKSMTPPPSPGAQLHAAPARRGLLVFAAAFAVVAVTVGVLPLFDRNPSVPVGSPSTTTPVSPPSTEPTGTTLSPVTCSGTGVVTGTVSQDLPAAVISTRDEIMSMAAMCDFEGLEALAAPGFVTSFGGGGAEAFAEWEADGKGKLGLLQQVLNLSFAEQVSGDGQTYYVWPAAFAYDNWDDISDEHMEELTSIYTESELDQLSEFGAYAGWRIGIRDNGDWMFFVAGD